MSNETYVGGSITVRPPVAALKIDGSPFSVEADGARDDRLVKEAAGREIVLVGDGVTADEVQGSGANGDTFQSDDIIPHLNELIALLGPGHTYDGALDCEGPGVRDFWRIRVVDGVAVREDAVVMYPADLTPPPGPDGLAGQLGPDDVEAALITLADLWDKDDNTSSWDGLTARQREVGFRVSALRNATDFGEESDDE